LSNENSTNKIVQVENLVKYYSAEQSFLDRIISRKEPDYIKAVDGINFSINKNETFALVGETGSGKSTVARLVLKLIEPTSGSILFQGQDINKFDTNQNKEFRKKARMIFQDPFASLNPRMTVGEILSLPMKMLGNYSNDEIYEIILETLERVGLSPANELIYRHPHEFSGGQRQRIGVARAIILNPEFIIADEPVTSLDVSIRAQVLNLLEDLKQEHKLTFLLIAHDLTIVRHMSDRVLVMYLGKPMELAPVEPLFENSLHPYTRSLLSAVPVADPEIKLERLPLKGEMPSAVNPPKGCRFHTRCPYFKNKCREEEPEFREIEKGHFVSCHDVN
jgi:oligopeptide/dipeptide ABC transporter ATP-binding protein